MDAGFLPLLQRIAGPMAGPEPPPRPTKKDRHIARLVAALAIRPEGATLLEGPPAAAAEGGAGARGGLVETLLGAAGLSDGSGADADSDGELDGGGGGGGSFWRRWLDGALAASLCAPGDEEAAPQHSSSPSETNVHRYWDRKLASHCRRALLNLRARRALAARERQRSALAAAAETTGINLRSLGLGDGGGERDPPTFADGVFFFVPHAATARWAARARAPGSPPPVEAAQLQRGEGGGSGEPAAAEPPGEPLVDVVFVHGLRGGPYNTWRVCQSEKEEAEDAGTGVLWPADWLAADLGGSVRLLSVGYRSSISTWEGHTLGLAALSENLLQNLLAAGCGQRPLVLIGHSLGGLLIKTMYSRASEGGEAVVASEASERRGDEGGEASGGEASSSGGAAAGGGPQLPVARLSYAPFADALRAAVFYSCPHFGSHLADIYNWRMFRPSPTVEDLSTFAPHFLHINAALRAAHHDRGVRVLSYLEGTPTKLAPLPLLRGRHVQAVVVPMESAYPGFGDVVVQTDRDHILSCKPISREDVAYWRTLELVRDVVEHAAQERAAGGGGREGEEGRRASKGPKQRRPGSFIFDGGVGESTSAAASGGGGGAKKAAAS